MATTPLYLLSLADQAAVKAVAIRVEQSHAAILLISGEDDQMWPSALMAEMVMERLRQHDYAYPYQHLSYPKGGHLIGVPFLPATTTYGRHSLTGESYAYSGAPRELPLPCAWNIATPEYLRAIDRNGWGPRGLLNDGGFRCTYYERVGP